MNIQNIAELAEQLKLLGLDDVSYILLKKISFRPDTFVLYENFEKQEYHLSIQCSFTKSDASNSYLLMYYDAILQKNCSISNNTFNEIDLAALDQRMKDIDWKEVFVFNTNKVWKADDKVSWLLEEKVDNIIEDLSKLEQVDEGKIVATNLKTKYWTGFPYQEFLGPISPLKSKQSVSQRFYFFEGEPGITIEQAFRFLQNKWVERQIQTNKKEAGIIKSDASFLENNSTQPVTTKSRKSGKNSLKKSTTKL